jgi:hypothetical protein
VTRDPAATGAAATDIRLADSAGTACVLLLRLLLLGLLLLGLLLLLLMLPLLVLLLLAMLVFAWAA